MKEIDIEYIKSKISDVLKNAHSDTRKHNIKDYNDRINFACPVCGDSQKDSNAKRANIYKDNPTYMVCFNEGCRASVTHLCSDFNVEIGLEEKQALYDYADAHIKFEKKDIYIPEHLNKLVNLDEFSIYLNEQSFGVDDVSFIKPIKNFLFLGTYIGVSSSIDTFPSLYSRLLILTFFMTVLTIPDLVMLSFIRKPKYTAIFPVYFSPTIP